MEKETRNVIIATGVGVAVGAVLGVLFAPAKGSETRSKIKEKANDLADKFEELKESFLAGELIPAEMMSTIKQFIDSTTQVVEEEVEDEIEDINKIIK